jgi:hypothetical protein
MPSEQAEKNNGPPNPPPSRVVVESMTDAHGLNGSGISIEEIEARAKDWDETVTALAAIRDETDTDEVWSEVLHNLGVETDGEGS